MPKHFPRYDICTLSEAPGANSHFMADTLAHYISEHKNLKFPHKHTFYHLVYFTSGSGKHSIDFIEFPVKAGQVYFMVPEQVHTWSMDSDTDGFIINFDEQFLSDLITNPRYPEQFSFFSGDAKDQVLIIPAKTRAQFEGLLKTIVDESRKEEQHAKDFIRTSLIQLFIVAGRCCATETRQSQRYNSVLLSNFKKLIDQYYKEKKLPKEYADLLFITPNHLNALTVEATGRSAGELIRDRIILEAKRLLVNADMSVSELAAELNFSDNSYFTKFFKKYVGVTPDSFRKQIQLN
jgi:AraC family transcriptional activator of pobA